jgi:hypothetical protein
MFHRSFSAHIVFWICASGGMLRAARMQLAPVAVGAKLQTSTSVKLSQPVAQEEVQVTLKSSDPERLRFARRPDMAGVPSISLPVRQGFDETPEFWVQAIGATGEVSYTASAPGFDLGNGKVTITPSAIAIVGPARSPKFQITPHSAPAPIKLYTVRLNASLEYVEQQALAGGLSVNLDLVSTNPGTGTIMPSHLVLANGASSAAVEFKPLASGTTELSVRVPTGFATPKQFANVAALVRVPGLVVTSDIAIGQNLQVSGLLGLGEAAPPGGAKVTLQVEDSDQLLLSREAIQVGSKSLEITVPEGGVSTPFYLQALGKSGVVTYTASAPGYSSRTGRIVLAPSGISIRPAPYGPPDEAEVLRKDGGQESSSFVSHLSKRSEMTIGVWTAQLDPVTMRSADITVQPLRAGMSLTVYVENRDPAVGTITSPVTIDGGSEHGSIRFTPLAEGTTLLSAATPKGFTKASNATSVLAVVKP